MTVQAIGSLLSTGLGLLTSKGSNAPKAPEPAPIPAPAPSPAPERGTTSADDLAAQESERNRDLARRRTLVTPSLTFLKNDTSKKNKLGQ